jgi:hypothetical protein
MQVAAKLSHPKTDEERERLNYARRQAYYLLRKWNAEDAEMGRDPEKLIERRQERCEDASDYEPRPKMKPKSVADIRQGMGV